MKIKNGLQVLGVSVVVCKERDVYLALDRLCNLGHHQRDAGDSKDLLITNQLFRRIDIANVDQQGYVWSGRLSGARQTLANCWVPSGIHETVSVCCLCRLQISILTIDILNVDQRKF